MKLIPSLRDVLMTVLLAGLFCAPPVAAETDDERFVRAVAAYDASQWPQAFAEFAELAGRGHADAARIAALMWRLGPALYRLSFRAGEEQLNRWLDLAACGMTQSGDHRCACWRSITPSCRSTTDNSVPARLLTLRMASAGLPAPVDSAVCSCAR